MTKEERREMLKKMKSESEERTRERFARIDKEVAIVDRRLHELGLKGKDFEEFLPRYAPLSPTVIETMLTLLPELQYERVQESIIRALLYSDGGFDGRPIVDCFNNTYDEGLRWAIINTIACARPKPHSIDEWIEEKLEHPYWGETLRNLGYK